MRHNFCVLKPFWNCLLHGHFVTKKTNVQQLNLLISQPPVTSNLPCTPLILWVRCKLAARFRLSFVPWFFCREKTGIIKLWALWQEWRGKSWIMLRSSLWGAGPRKGPQGRKMMAATIEKSKPNESLSFPDPSTTRDAVATHLLPHPHSDNLPSSAGFLHTMTPYVSSPQIHHI